MCVLVLCVLATYFDLIYRARYGQLVAKDTSSLAAALTFTWGLENYVRLLLLVFCLHNLMPLEADLLEMAELYQAWGAWVVVEVLPGALLRNDHLKYNCKAVSLDVVNAQTRFTAGYAGRREAVMTVGNGEGNFFADEATLDRLEGEGQVVFRYRDNPNGSARGIAGIVNPAGNVLGMMPHPDRAFEAELGSADGAILFQSVMASA